MFEKFTGMGFFLLFCVLCFSLCLTFVFDQHGLFDDGGRIPELQDRQQEKRKRNLRF